MRTFTSERIQISNGFVRRRFHERRNPSQQSDMKPPRPTASRCELPCKVFYWPYLRTQLRCLRHHASARSQAITRKGYTVTTDVSVTDSKYPYRKITAKPTCSMPTARASSTPYPCSLAYSRTSSVIFMEQNLGPHMEQKCAVLPPSAGSVSSWYDRAVGGSRARLNWSFHLNSKRALDKVSSHTYPRVTTQTARQR